MIYRCPECGKTHVYAQLFGYTCKKDWYKAHDCPMKIVNENKWAYEYKDVDFDKRLNACYKCDFRGDSVYTYVCKDCNKAFFDIVIELNETIDGSNDTAKVQNAFVLKNEDLEPTPEGE